MCLCFINVNQEPKPAKAKAPAAAAASKPAAAAAATGDREVKKVSRLGLEAKKDENLSDWYSQVHHVVPHCNYCIF